MQSKYYGLLFITIGLSYSQLAFSQTSTQFGPDGHVTIENGSGGFIANLESGDRFSRDHDAIGDVNGDGIIDLAVGARSDDDGATDAGAVYILFMNNDGSVQSNQKISMLEGGFNETLNESNFFGYGVAGIGDYDGDTIPDIAVSSPVPPNNSIYIIHLNANGTVKDFVKTTGITAQGLSAIGDINNDTRIDLVACNPSSNAGGTQRGAIDLIFFDSNSELMPGSTVTISSTQGGFGAGLANGDRFGGREVAMMGDIDNNGSLEMAVGAFLSDGGKGALWILSLNPNTFLVESKLKITEGMSGFTDSLTTGANPNGTEGANFGHAVCAPGDLNGDGIPDLITGANQQNEGYGYILYMNADGTVKTYTRINNTDGGFGISLDAEERFSRSISFVGDLRGDGTLAVNLGGGAGGTGTLYLLFFKPCVFTAEAGNYFWSAGTTLFSNWDHTLQTLTGDSLTFEQCTFKAFENDASFITYNPADGRCICKDDSAILTASTELSTAYTNACYSGFSVGVEDQQQETFKIYPNPTTGTVQIDFPNAVERTVEVYDLTGKSILSERTKSEQANFNLHSVETGVYLLKITEAMGISFSKVSVVR